MIEQVTAEMTIFNPDVKDALDDQQTSEYTNGLTRAYMLNVILNNPSNLANSYSFTATPNSAGIVTYNITIYENYSDTYSNYGPCAIPPTKLSATVYPVSHGSLLDRNVDNLTMGVLSGFTDWSEFTANTIIGFAFDKLMGLETASGLVCDFGHIAEDIASNMNDYIQISGIQNLQEIASAMEHLGMSASIGNIDGFFTCNTVINGVRFNPTELVIRLNVYQEDTGITLTEQDIRSELNGGDSSVLTAFDDWYVEQEGEDKIDEYRNDLAMAYASYSQNHPEISDFEHMTRQETNDLILYYENQ